MKIADVSFPHPVLGIGDDVTPEPGFASRPHVVSHDEHFEFIIPLKMDNEDIMKLCRAGTARFVCEVNCPATFFRKCYSSESPEFNIKISQSLLAAKTTFQLFVIALKQFSYSNSGFHQDYANNVFEIQPGDIIAYMGEFSYDASIDYQKIYSVGSFMEIAKGSNSELQFEYDSDKIIIRLPESMYTQYRERIAGNNDLGNVIHSSLVLNALISALMNYGDYADRLWARILDYRVRTEPQLAQYKEAPGSQDFNEISSFARELLQNPYRRMLNSLVALIDTEED